jgi:hypothetical protein
MSDPIAIGALEDEQLEQLVDALAPRIAAELAPELARAMRELANAQPQRDEWLSAGETADRFALTTDWLYRHADKLGALRLGDGPKARLRFSPAKIEQVLSARPPGNGSEPAEAPPPAAKPPRPHPKHRAGADRVPQLLPYRRREE